ncbi:murein hydrolase activator EnvC family protein [Defluviitalea phaphyphila]|uniref:murein hydrolase activator EnvC family protein n=1 Tax=Defluviitalea phaphyphila TaxID=1473580 RepID=UPI000730F4A5|nr:M23 family metallopeptidase [Defluviitalea phaphyphila]
MKKVLKKGAILVIILMLGCTSIIPSLADTLTDKKNRLKEVQESLENAKKNLEEIKEKKENITQTIAELDEDLNNVNAYLEDINKQLEELEQEVSKKQNELKIAEENRQLQYEEFKERFKYMYMNKKVGYIQVLLNSKSFADLLNRVDIISRIVEYDQNLMEKMKENEEKIEKQKKELEEKQEEVMLVKKHQLSLKYSIEETMEKREAMLMELNKDELAYMELIKEEEQISKQLEEEIKELTRKSTMVYSGEQFEWPVPGYYTLSSTYGYRPDPIYGGSEFHKGIDIPAPRGESVVAAADGEVIASGYINGYGYTVIINHGSGISTLYGHNSKLVVSVGQIVQRGQKIAEIGSTGNSTGNHCHFEVRIDGATTNPMNYFSK